jgi:hypothetical protein
MKHMIIAALLQFNPPRYRAPIKDIKAKVLELFRDKL